MSGGSVGGGSVRRALAWSFANNLVMRFASLALGIVLARLLVPSAFGVFAIGLTVQSLLGTLTDLGLSTDLVRTKDPASRAPTVATLSVTIGTLLAAAMMLTAEPVAAAFNEPQAAGVIRVMAATCIVMGAAVVPYAKLLREFKQGKLFACAIVDFVVNTSVTVSLVLLGMGPMSLALGRLAALLVSTVVEFWLAGVRPRFGFDRKIARSAMAFGVPITGANLLSLALLNVDNVVVARAAGAAPLGLYVLAFNVSTWPMNAIGQAVRSVTLPGFSRASSDAEQRRAFLMALKLTWLVALPVGVLLAAVARPLVLFMYGEHWAGAAPALAALGVFGGLRVAFDLIATYLMARGAARPVFYVQALWFLGLIPPMIVATHWKGIAGAGWSHLVVGALVILPAYAVALRRLHIPLRSILSVVWLPIVAAVPMWWLGQAAADEAKEPILGLLMGGTVAVLVYLVICSPWIVGLLPARRAAESAAPEREVPMLTGVAS
ncbi:MAG: oligosaccharide flippase family protein [Solirubrobacteraceae bacterium]